MQHWLANWRLRASKKVAATSGRTQLQVARRIARAPRKRCGRSAFARHTRPVGRSTTSPCRGVTAAVPAARTDRRGHDRILGRPLAHPFQPLLAPRLREFALREGLADARQRFASAITSPPASGHPMRLRPGYGARLRRGGRQPLHGRRPFATRRHRARPPVGGSDVIAFGRDLRVSYRVWSPVGLPRATPPTVTSTPTTTSPVSSRPVSPAAGWVRRARPPMTRSAPTMRSTPTSPTSSNWCAAG